MSLALSFSGRALPPAVLQSESGECGLACLAMVLQHHGVVTDLATLRRRHGTAQRGLTLQSLMQLADREGLAARALRLEPEDLHMLRLPAILHWNLDHFVVLQRVRGDELLLHDPAQGERKLALGQAGRSFSGVALELQPAPGFVPRVEAVRLRLRDLWSRSRGVWTALWQLFVLSALLQLFALALPFYTQLFIDDVLVSQDHALLKVLASGFFMVAVVRSATEWLRARVVLHVGSSIGYQLGVNLCRHLLRLPLAWFRQRHLGDILSRFGSINNLRDFIGSGLVEACIDALMATGTLVLMFVYSNTLTWVALVAVLIYLLLRLALHSSLRSRNEEAIHAAARENSNFMENIRAIQGIRLFGRESDRLGLWQNLFAARLNAAVRAQLLGIDLRLAHGLLVGTENIVLLLLGGLAVLRNDISVGMVMAYISFKDQFYSRVFALLDKLFEFRLLGLHLERLADIALSEQEPHRHGVGAPPPEVCLKGGLLLQDLGYRHGPDAPWLFRHVDLEVGNEEVVALIGPTGCGKSTLLKLVLSLLQPDEGSVSMHGVPVQVMGLDAWRQRVAAVLQDDALLSGSIADNIACFDPAPDRQRIEYAASLAALAQDIRVMPMQYDTPVGNMGATLSGGQVQRLLLARALYRQPRLLVLDEATSHLDLATEKAVNGAIRQLRIARLIVAHRPDTILLADRIVELTPEGLRPLAHAEVRARLDGRHGHASVLTL